MSPELGAWLTRAQALGADYERGALDLAGGRVAAVLAVLGTLAPSPGTALYPWGLDGDHLWEPWERARQAVESLPQDPQERGAQADYILHDAAAGLLVLGKVGPWRPGCPRLESRACPRMAPMGHESPHAECNYWGWRGMAQAAPGVELFPEWQRFDCSRYYPLFQIHLCGEALAAELKAEARWSVHGPAAWLKGLSPYPALTSRPGAFTLLPTAAAGSLP
jgi:hypothetical protein